MVAVVAVAAGRAECTCYPLTLWLANTGRPGRVLRLLQSAAGGEGGGEAARQQRQSERQRWQGRRFNGSRVASRRS